MSQAWISFFLGLFPQPIASNEVEVYGPELDRIISYGVPLPTDYKTNIIACAYMFDDFVTRLLRRDTTMPSRLGLGYIELALGGLLLSLRVSTILMMQTMTTGSAQKF